MFDRLLGRGRRLALTRAQRRRRQLGAILEQALPEDLLVEEVEDGVAIAGRALGERYARDPELRWRLAELVR